MKEGKVKELASILNRSGVGVLPTDTLYGLVGRALDQKAVARIKKLKKRRPGKPFIILISSLKDLDKFKIKLSNQDREILSRIWPGPVSAALTNKLSFRWPKSKFLVELIKKTGPLIAPSANPEGSTPAPTITEAKKYFQEKVDFYQPADRKLSNQPSTLIKIKNGKVEILRHGKYKLRGI